MMWKSLVQGLMAGIILSFSVQTCLAEDNTPTYMLDEILVTSSGSETTRQDAPGSVDVVTKEEIEKRNVKDVDEAVRMITGVFDRRTKGFGDISPSINIRGLYGSNRNLILIDGQPVSEDVWRRYPLTSVKKIEVVKGPFSSLYGSGAMGGAVNIITRKPEDLLELKIDSGYQTYNTPYYGVLLSGKMGKWIYSASARKRETDGYESIYVVKSASAVTEVPTSGTEVTGVKTTNDKYGNTKYHIGTAGENYYNDVSYNFKIGRDFSPETSITFDYTRTDYEYGYEGNGSFLRDSSGNTVDTGTAYFYDDANATWRKISSLSSTTFQSTYGGNAVDLVNLTGKTKINDITLRASASYDKNDYWWVQPSLSSAYSKPSSTEKKRAEIVAIKPLPMDQTLTAGAEVRNVGYEQNQYSLSDWTDKNSRTETTLDLEGETTTLGLFLQDEIKFFDSLTIYLGGRLDRWSTEDGYNWIIKSGTEKTYTFDERTENSFSPRLSLVYKLDPTARIKASVGQSFRGPTASELYSGYEYTSSGEIQTYLPNPDLKPEKVLSTELGFEKMFINMLFGKASYFYNYMDDYIYKKTFNESEREKYNLENYGSVDHYGTIYQRQNIGESRSQGIEIELTAYLPHGFNTFVNCTAMSTEVLENPTNPDSEGKKIPSVPETMANAGIDYTNGNFSGGLVGRYASDVYSTDDNSDTEDGVYGGYDSFFLADFKVSYRFKLPSGITPVVSLTCDNIFDEEYFQYYLSPGRTWGVHVSLGYNRSMF